MIYLEGIPSLDVVEFIVCELVSLGGALAVITRNQNSLCSNAAYDDRNYLFENRDNREKDWLAGHSNSSLDPQAPTG